MLDVIVLGRGLLDRCIYPLKKIYRLTLITLRWRGSVTYNITLISNNLWLSSDTT
jgi:hypothetical protein